MMASKPCRTWAAHPTSDTVPSLTVSAPSCPHCLLIRLLHFKYFFNEAYPTYCDTTTHRLPLPFKRKIPKHSSPSKYSVTYLYLLSVSLTRMQVPPGQRPFCFVTDKYYA